MSAPPAFAGDGFQPCLARQAEAIASYCDPLGHDVPLLPPARKNW